jgi:hypothetical protein
MIQEHIKKLFELNEEDRQDLLDLEDDPDNWNIRPPEMKEIHDAIKNLSDKACPGDDAIS